MNPKLKLGITMMTTSALILSTGTAFAGATKTSAQTIPESILELMLEEGLITEAQMDTYLEKSEASNLLTLKSELQTLVSSGALTQGKADTAYLAIVADLENAKVERVKMAAMTTTELSSYLEALKETSATSELDALKTAGTLTTVQYNKIKALLNLDSDIETLGDTAVNTTNLIKSTRTAATTNSATAVATTEATRLAEIKTQLSALVTKGTLTQTQANKVYVAIVSDQETMTDEREKITDMTSAELTAAQYTAVQKILMPNSSTASTTKSATTATNTKIKATTSLTTIKTKLAAMVTKGTLAQAQANAAYTAIVADQTTSTVDLDSLEDMTIEELVAYMAGEKTLSTTSALDALKTNGILTTTQYNAIKAILTASQENGSVQFQNNFQEAEMEQPPDMMPPMQQIQKRQGK